MFLFFLSSTVKVGGNEYKTRRWTCVNSFITQMTLGLPVTGNWPLRFLIFGNYYK